jgi:hypothetical protein
MNKCMRLATQDYALSMLCSSHAQKYWLAKCIVVKALTLMRTTCHCCCAKQPECHVNTMNTMKLISVHLLQCKMRSVLLTDSLIKILLLSTIVIASHVCEHSAFAIHYTVVLASTAYMKQLKVSARTWSRVAGTPVTVICTQGIAPTTAACKLVSGARALIALYMQHTSNEHNTEHNIAHVSSYPCTRGDIPHWN